MEFAHSGFDVHGIDIDPERVEKINQGESHVLDVKDETLRVALASRKFRAHSDYRIVSKVDCISICVPTPLRKTRDPDVSYILEACYQIKTYLRAGTLVILESTTYPGTTEEVVLPELGGRNGFKVGENFFLAFSPERVDPGNTVYNTKNTPKIVGGVTPACTEMAKTLYEQALETVVPVSSTKTAEMVKLLENTYRAVNIGLVNEIAIMSDKLGISVWEVVEAAATKPFGFMPFFPGPGLGGHCIPIDPLYLSWKLKTLDYNARFIELASEMNLQMPEYCVSKISKALNAVQKCVNGAKILVLGVAYKKDISDVRESPALDIIRLLESDGAKVDYFDPYVPQVRANGHLKSAVSIAPENVSRYDLVVLTTDHSNLDYSALVESAQLVFDTRNAISGSFENVIKL
jgi:UDP-N-acetyl-D-glucosamine dehydrogenase